MNNDHRFWVILYAEIWWGSPWTKDCSLWFWNIFCDRIILFLVYGINICDIKRNIMEIFLAWKKAKCKMVRLWLFITSATYVEPFFVYYTVWKVSKYGVISGPNTGKHGPEITPYLDTFHAVLVYFIVFFLLIWITWLCPIELISKSIPCFFK